MPSEHALAAGAEPASGPVRWWEPGLDSYLSRLESQRGLSPNTVAAYRRDLRQFFGYVDRRGVDGLGRIDRKVIRGFLGSLDRQGYARRSVARKASAIRAFLTDCVRRGDLELDEGCLSIPDYRGKVHRALHVRVRAQDRDGNAIRIKAEDSLLAQALQHEIDHLNGILYIDHLVSKDAIWKLSDEEPTEEPSTSSETSPP